MMSVVAFSNESDNPVFDGMFDFCQMYCGASIGLRWSDDSCGRCGGKAESGFESNLRQLVRWTAPREEGRGVGFLLYERYCAGHPGASQVVSSSK